MKKFAALSALSFALLVSGTSIAANRSQAKDQTDQGKVVCRNEESTGSRLSQVKRCMTLAQWAEEKRVNRQEIERIQSVRDKSS